MGSFGTRGGCEYKCGECGHRTDEIIKVYEGDRYTERGIELDSGAEKNYYITFSTSGNKLFQTFGTADTILELYDSSNQLLETTNNNGYSYNALIRYSINANTTYRIKIRTYNGNLGTTKLVIIPAYAVANSPPGAINNYEDIRNFNSEGFSWYSYSQQYYMRVITFTPTVSGTYTISLESEFDNYLYVLDPRDTITIIEDRDYDDDSGGNYNAEITRYLQANIPYLIVYGPWNMYVEFENYDSGDDIYVYAQKQ